jgi:hypothetical protein
MEENLYLGIGTRLQHTQLGPGVIVGIRYATYLISFIDHGIREIDKDDPKLDEIIAENVTEEIETHSEVEKSLLKVLRMWNGSASRYRWVTAGSVARWSCSLLIGP